MTRKGSFCAKFFTIGVNLSCHPGEIVLEVTDDGSGIADSI
jgi:hypothetical protein